MKKLTTRQKQSIATKLNITQKATELFKEKGFENVKIQDICDAANISIGAFYHHFQSKNEIINKAYEQIDLLVKERYEPEHFIIHIDKICFILTEGCSVLNDLGWIFVSDVYKNLLYVDGKYSLNPNRFITVEIKSALDLAIDNNEINSTVSSEELALTLLRTARGVIFDWCLFQGSYDLKETMKNDINLILSNFRV